MFTIDVRAVIEKNRVYLKTLISPHKNSADRYIKSATILLNGRVINQFKMTRSMAKSPYIDIRFKGFMNDNYEIICIDNVNEAYRRKGIVRK